MHARAYKPRKVVFGGFGVGLDLIPGETLRASRARQRVSLPASKVRRRASEDLPESENHDETEKHGRVARDDRHGRPALRKKQLEHPCIYLRTIPHTHFGSNDSPTILAPEGRQRQCRQDQEPSRDSISGVNLDLER